MVRGTRICVRYAVGIVPGPACVMAARPSERDHLRPAPAFLSAHASCSMLYDRGMNSTVTHACG
jgi:hypothetical protein